MAVLYPIAKNTFVQTLRMPIFGVMIFLTFAVLVVSLPLSGWTMSTDYETTDQRMLETVGLSTLLVMGLFTAAFCASAALSREIEDRTALTVLSKPVWRGAFVAGKLLGVAAAITVFYYLTSLAFLLTVRHHVVSNASAPYDWPVIVLGLTAFLLGLALAGAGNYLFGWSFLSASVLALLVTLTCALGAVSIIGKGWKAVSLSYTFGPENLRPQLLIGLLLIYQAVLILVAVAVAASTRLGLLLTLLVCLAVMLGGSAQPFLARVLDQWRRGAGYVTWPLPNLTLFYPLDALAGDADIPARRVGLAAAYFALYVAGALVAGMALFQTRQLEAKEGGAAMPGAVALLSGLGRLAAAVMLIAVIILLFQANTYTPTGWIVPAVLAVAAVAGWIVFRAFAAGRAWSYWITLSGAVALLARSAAVWRLPQWTTWLRSGEPATQTILIAIVAALVLLALLLPKSRHHFKS
jgi:ABC-type transport system involved in multi-copper enzyme maturation permease subunit